MNVMTPLTQREIEELFRSIDVAREGGRCFDGFSMSVKVICVNPETPKIAMVKNKPKAITEDVKKESAWELPGGGVRFDQLETPKDAAMREFNQETGIPFSMFEITEVLGGFRKANIKRPTSGNYHYDVVFIASIKEMSEKTRGGSVTSDPTEGTLEWCWADPFNDISKDGHRYSMRGERVHGSSIAMINRFLFQNGD